MRQASIGGTCNEKDLSLFVSLHMLARKAGLFERTKEMKELKEMKDILKEFFPYRSDNFLCSD